MQECQVRFYECEFDQRRWNFICGVFGKASSRLLEVLNGTLKKRGFGAKGTEPLVAGVFVGDEGMSRVRLGRRSSGCGIPCADELGREPKFASDV